MGHTIDCLKGNISHNYVWVAWSAGAFASPGSAGASTATLKSSAAMRSAVSKDMLLFLDAYTGTLNLGNVNCCYKIYIYIYIYVL